MNIHLSKQDKDIQNLDETIENMKLYEKIQNNKLEIYAKELEIIKLRLNGE